MTNIEMLSLIFKDVSRSVEEFANDRIQIMTEGQILSNEILKDMLHNEGTLHRTRVSISMDTAISIRLRGVMYVVILYADRNASLRYDGTLSDFSRKINASLIDAHMKYCRTYFLNKMTKALYLSLKKHGNLSANKDMALHELLDRYPDAFEELIIKLSKMNKSLTKNILDIITAECINDEQVAQTALLLELKHKYLSKKESVKL